MLGAAGPGRFPRSKRRHSLGTKQRKLSQLRLDPLVIFEKSSQKSVRPPWSASRIRRPAGMLSAAPLCAFPGQEAAYFGDRAAQTSQVQLDPLIVCEKDGGV